ncbi:MAG: hypothetical protein V2I56_01565 [Desulfobacteraceae bacterium]|nr:hypothetical protein [Desulfobacteraceae bacterium]
MKNNPCLVCRMRDEDKNNRLCRECEKRIGYVQKLEQELNFSMSYDNTRLYARVGSPLEAALPGGLRTVFGR